MVTTKMLDLVFIINVVSKCRFLLIISRARIVYYMFTVNVTVMFTRATYINFIQNCVHVEITCVFDTCKIALFHNKCTIIFMNNNYMFMCVIIYDYSDILA